MENLPENYFEKSLAYTQKTHIDEYAAIDPSTPALSQKDKIIVIVGASRGIGLRGFVKQFARAAPKALVLVATNAEKLAEAEKFVHQINNKIEVLSVAANIAKEEDVKNIFGQVQAKFGRHADVVVQNAAVSLNHDKTIKQTESKDWTRELEINLFGYYFVVKNFLASLPDNHAPVTMILLTSWHAFLGMPTVSAYVIAKMAAVQLAQITAAEEPNVNIVALHPGVVETDMTVDSFKRFARDSPELVGGTAVWLATEQAAFMSGRTMNANWDVTELVAKKEQILSEDELKAGFKGKLGAQ